MPYSNRRRHNLPCIPQTPCETLIIPCPNFDPIYQVILLENFNEWNLSSAKRRILKKKKKEQELKSKEDEIGNLLGEILLKESKKGDVTPTFYKNKFLFHIGVHIKMHIKL
jgi:hypothetical protein